MTLDQHDEYTVTAKPNGVLEVLRQTVVTMDGEVFGRKNDRTTLAPGDDLTGQPEAVTAIANTIWTPDVIAAYRASIPAQPGATA